MSYNFLITGFMIMLMQTNMGLCSALLEGEENKAMRQAVVIKAQKKPLNLKDFNLDEKEWIYEVDLLNSLRSLKSDYKKFKGNFGGLEDLSRVAGDLANFYSYKGHPDLAHQKYLETAKWDLKAISQGSENHLAYLNSLTEQEFLSKKCLEKILASSKENSEGVTGKPLFQEKEFKEIQEELARAYAAYAEQVKKKRRANGLRAIPLYDESLKVSLEDAVFRKNKKLKK